MMLHPITALAVILLLALTAATRAADEKAPPSTAPAVEKPGPTNTGPTDASALKEINGITITEDGTVLENVKISGMVTIKANNVTIRNFILDAGGASYGIRAINGNTGGKFERGEIINFDSAALYGTGFTATGLNIHESGADGVKIQGKGGPTIVEKCWIHHIGKNDEAHADGNQSIGVDNVVFRYNNFDLPITAPAPYKQNACFILQDKGTPVTNFVVENNWLNGGGWVIYVPKEGAETIKIINNKFGRDFKFGIMSGKPGEFTGNTWEDDGTPVDIKTTRKQMDKDRGVAPQKDDGKTKEK